MTDSPLRGDVPEMKPEHKYHLESNVKKTSRGIDTKFRWTCLCGEKGEWTFSAGLAGSGWTTHIEESAAASRKAIYERCPEPSCLDGERMYLGANGHFFGKCNDEFHKDES